MNDNEKRFEDFVRDIKFDDTPDANHRDKLEQDLLRALAKQTQQRETPSEIWRTIMKTRITKLATAAVIILAVVLSVTFLDKSVAPAWSIEQTIEAVREFDSLYLHGFVFGFGEFEAWARPRRDRSRSGDCRFQTAEGSFNLALEDENITYRYEAGKNLFIIESGITCMINPWLSSNFIEKIREQSEDWQEEYGKDNLTGRDSVFIKATFPQLNVSGQCYWLQIDLESSLPVRAKVWENVNFEGTAHFDIRRIIYNPDIPPGTFSVEIPSGARVVDYREQFKQILADPNYGMPVERLTKDEACKKIVELYWEAMIDEDWEKARKLRSFPKGELWEDWKAQYLNNMPAEIVNIKEPYDESDWVTTPMVIRMADDTIKKGKLLVKFREINGVKSCLIIGNYGPRELNDPE